MIYLIHNEAKTFEKAFRNDEALLPKSINMVDVFWELAKAYPNEILVWVEKQYYGSLDEEYFKQLFRHQNIMASYPIETRYFSDDIGYVDQLPFVNAKRDVEYPTWLMSTDAGGIYGITALKFRSLFKEIKGFGYLINSISKLGQQNSLFCYSDPGLVNHRNSNKLEFQASSDELISFVSQHYKREWVWVLAHCLKKYNNEVHLKELISGFTKGGYFWVNIDLGPIELEKSADLSEEHIDIVIPTLGRPQHVFQVLKDLKQQSLLPTKVIIIEQNADRNSNTELNFIKDDWPFEIIHTFTHQTGACNARNLALKEVSSKWVFLADDDIRLPDTILERSMVELQRLKVDALNLACLQPGEEPIFRKIKQWGAFGSGTSIIRSSIARECKFDEVLEFGFGEDLDFGLQLRAKGCDIIYHPDLIFTHLKADRGGFRSTSVNRWEDKGIEPKPSPTMMYLIRKHYSPEMIRGYKISLFLKFFRKQQTKNPIKYYRLMQKRWRKSEELCDRLRAKVIEQ